MDQYPPSAEADRLVSANQDAVPLLPNESELDNDFSIRDSVNSVIDHFQGLLAGEIVAGLSTGFE